VTDLVNIEHVGNRQQDAMLSRSCLVHSDDPYDNELVKGGSAVTR